ncbi:MAG: ComEC/Rec2 family competence protein [bacterium]|nr:ComEC/Rec2 family competence protein [bacterium]
MGSDSKNNPIIWIVIVLACFNLLAWSLVFKESPPHSLKVVFFDIGQGSSVFIETPQHAQILIDGGPSNKIVEKLGRTMPFFDRSIDLIISTHPDFDHLAGLVEVLKSYQVEAVGSTGVKGQTAEFEEFMTKTNQEGAEKIILKRGETIRVGRDLKIEVLAPLEDFVGREVKDYNTSSLVFKVSYGQTDFLLTGDAPVSIEKELVEIMKSDLGVEILQVGHHGSKSSTSQAWLEAVIPEIAVIQVGRDNRYGHPNQEVLERLKNYGIKILRTDEQGDIKIISNGENYELSFPQN